MATRVVMPVGVIEVNKEIKDLSTEDLIPTLLTSDGKGREYKKRCLQVLLAREFTTGAECVIQEVKNGPTGSIYENP